MASSVAGTQAARAELPSAFDACSQVIEGLAATTEAEPQPLGYDAYLCFYLAGARTGELDVAAAHLQRLENSTPTAWPLLVRAHIAYASNDTATAKALYRSAAAQFENAVDAAGSVGAVIARTNLRVLLRANGELDEASKQADLAMRTAEAGGDTEALIRASVLEAQHIVDSDLNLAPALRALQRAESLAFPEGPLGLQSSILLSLADTHFDLGHFDEAIAVYERLREHKEALDDPTELSTIDFNLVNVRLTQLEFFPEELARQGLIGEAKAALERAKERKQWSIAARLAGTLADLERHRNPKQAARYLDSCRRFAGRGNDEKPLIHCRWSEALLLQTTDPDAALLASRDAMAQAREIKADLFFAFAARAHSRIAWSALDPEEAFSESLATLDSVEALRTAQEQASRAEVFTTWANDYHYLVNQLLVQDQPARAFEITERMRARSLLEDLHGTRLSRAGLNHVGRKGDGREEPEHASLATVQSALRPSEAMLLWSVGLEQDLYYEDGGGSWLMLVTANAVHAERVADIARLSAMTTLYSSQLESSEPTLEAHHGVFHAVFGKSLDRLDPSITTLLLAHDDVLHRLPFAALRGPENDQPIGTRFALSAIPSATLWLGWRRQENLRNDNPNGERESAASQKPSHDKTVLILGDPTVRASSHPRGSPSRSLQQRSLDKLAPLPFARKESREVLAVLGQGTLWLGENASEARLKSADLEEVGLLHFAAHAISDGANPDLSSVILAAGSEHEDGWLQADEISELHLDQAIVVLSACQTSSGPLLRGEGVFSLGRAFLQAGARTVVATRWNVRDDQAQRLVGFLYQGLAEGKTAAEAVRDARFKAIEAGLPTAVWAGFEVIGDGNAAWHAKDRSPFLQTLPLVVATVFFLGLSAWLLQRSGARASTA